MGIVTEKNKLESEERKRKRKENETAKQNGKK